MIRVTIELIPYGIGEPELLHEAVIYNDGTGTTDSGNYRAMFGRKGRPVRSAPVRHSTVKSFPRRRLNALHLVARALKGAGYG